MNFHQVHMGTCSLLTAGSAEVSRTLHLEQNAKTPNSFFFPSVLRRGSVNGKGGERS